VSLNRKDESVTARPASVACPPETKDKDLPRLRAKQFLS